MIYDEIISALDVKEGERIWLASELIPYYFQCRKSKEEFDASHLIDAFQNAIGPAGTLLIPTFTYDAKNYEFFDIKNSKSITGVLTNTALKRPDFKRTKHPKHSFAVWGADQDLLVNMENKNSFGIDSPFAYCLSKNVRQIMFGTDYDHCFTFVHFAEFICNVPYRYTKEFNITYVDEDGKESQFVCEYPVRDLSIEPTQQMNLIGEVLEKKGIAKMIPIRGIKNYSVDLAKSYPVICSDILDNMCRNIYDFNVSREELFADWKNKNTDAANIKLPSYD